MNADEVLSEIRSQGYYAGQIQDHRVVEGTPAETASLDVSQEVAVALTEMGIDSLYRHQATAIEAVRNDQHTVVATQTASGKSLIYTIPAIERAIQDDKTTLYIAPQIALLNDQEKTLSEFAQNLGFGADLDVAAYHSDIGRQEKQAIKSRQPDLILTTPDQVHLSLLPYGKHPNNWRWLMESLDLVVVDEVHHYRGVFGSHTSLIFRRLNRLAEQFGAKPQYVCCSATIGNPIEHAAAVCGQDSDEFTLIDEDTSATGDRNWVIWNPPVKQDDSSDESDNETSSTTGTDISLPAETEAASQTSDSSQGGSRLSSHQQSINLLIDLLQEGYQTLVFTRTRQGAERYAKQTDNRLRKAGQHDLAEATTAYHGNVDDQRRSEIEYKLKQGKMRAVWSTNALELGIDIGTLDAVILDGYPGSRMETFQRAGRAGRGDNECLVFLVATDNPLDQHMVTHPEKLFDEQPERAVINPANKTILPDHVVCAANEHILSVDDEAHFGDTLPDVVTKAEAAGRLNRTEERAGRWRCTEEQPAWEMRDRIRSIDERTITIENQYSGEHVSSLGLGDALQDAHPGAIYAYQKDLYRVTEVDYDEDRAYLKSVDDKGQYTQPLQDKKITVHSEYDQDTLTGPAGDIQIGQADLTVSTVPTGYLEYTHGKDTEPIEYTYDEGEQPPSQDLRTDSLYLAIPDSVRTAALPAPLDSDSHYVDGLHAIEHAMISLLPQEVLCDRRDIGGLSTNYHEWTGTGSIFIHDGYEGGVGLSTAAYETLPSLLQSTHDLLSECQCDDGCPACIQSPHCGNGNRNLSKEHALTILRQCLLPEG